MSSQKKRLDALLVERYPQFSRSQLQSWIIQGKVKIEGTVVTKAGTQVSPNDDIVLSVEEPKYVSRAGFKLEKALDHFNVDVNGLVIMDAGLSTDYNTPNLSA